MGQLQETIEFWDGSNRYVADTCIPLVEATKRNETSLYAWVHGHYPGQGLPTTVLPQLMSVGYWSADREQAWHLPRHRNEGIEITFVENGTLSFSVEDERFDLEPNALTVTRPWQAHDVGREYMNANKLIWVIIDVGVRRPNQEWHWPEWILLDPLLLTELTRYIRQNETPVWFSARRMRRCFEEIARTVEEGLPEPVTYDLLKIRMNELLLNLLNHYRTREVTLSDSYTSNERAVEVFLKQLEETLESPWTVDEMARRCGVGTTSLSNYCKELTNLTPLRYLNKLRIKRSESLLRTTNLSVLDISLECGFSSSQYFSVQFRKEHGVTPSTYRKQLRSIPQK